jgi:hypothetical protein
MLPNTHSAKLRLSWTLSGLLSVGLALSCHPEDDQTAESYTSVGIDEGIARSCLTSQGYYPRSRRSASGSGISAATGLCESAATARRTSGWGRR